MVTISKYQNANSKMGSQTQDKAFGVPITQQNAKCFQVLLKWCSAQFCRKPCFLLVNFFLNFWLNSNIVGAFFKVLLAKPWSLTLYSLRQVWYNIPAITGDRATQECDPPAVIVPYGRGLVSSLMPTLYNSAGCYNAINSSPQSGLLLNFFSTNFIG